MLSQWCSNPLNPSMKKILLSFLFSRSFQRSVPATINQMPQPLKLFKSLYFASYSKLAIPHEFTLKLHFPYVFILANSLIMKYVRPIYSCSLNKPFNKLYQLWTRTVIKSSRLSTVVNNKAQKNSN